MKTCPNCKRTFKGFLRMCWGVSWLPAFNLFGAKWYIQYGDWREKIGEWILIQVGWGRNPGWSSRNERKTCTHILSTLLIFLFLFASVGWGQKDTTKQKLFNGYGLKNATGYVLNIGKPINDYVFEIDTAGVVKVPKGWEMIIVVKNGKAWAIDSSKKNLSRPKDW